VIGQWTTLIGTIFIPPEEEPGVVARFGNQQKAKRKSEYPVVS